MSKPQVINVPPNAGIGTVPPVQVPLIGSSAITLINQNSYLGLTLCNDDRFNPTTTWPLSPGAAQPQTGVNNLWIQNPNTEQITVLVIEGIIPTALTAPSGFLPIGSPPTYIGESVMNGSTAVTVPNIKIPPGVQGIVFLGENGLFEVSIHVTGDTSNISYLYSSSPFTGTTWAIAQLSNALDKTITLTFTAGTTFEKVYYFWVYNIEDFGTWSIPSSYGEIFAPPGYGKNTIINNLQVPVSVHQKNYGTPIAMTASVTTATSYQMMSSGTNISIFQISIHLTGTGLCTAELQVGLAPNYNVLCGVVANHSPDYETYYNQNLMGMLIQPYTLTLVTTGLITSCRVDVWYE